MRDASVGFQCPECVREGARTVRTPKTVAGGRVSASPGIVTKILLGINVLAYLAQQNNYESVTSRFGGFDLIRYRDGTIHGAATGEYYRLITEAFLHVNMLHIAFNMYLLYVLGRQLEAAMGRLRFAGVYLISALGGSVLSYQLGQNGIGASGAVFGLFAATFIVAKRLRVDTSQITFLILFNLVFSFAAKGIGYWAHIGGLITGAAITAILIFVPRGPRRDVIQGVGVGAVVALLLAMALTRTHSLQPARRLGLPQFAQAPPVAGWNADSAVATTAASAPSSRSGSTISRSATSISMLR